MLAIDWYYIVNDNKTYIKEMYFNYYINMRASL